jgi:hypothetical protein
MDTPDTMNFMILGYAVIFAAMAVYVASLLVRFKNLRADEQMLKDLDKE